MPLLSKKAFFRDYVFCVSKDVYEPAEDSFFFADHLAVEDGDIVLDMGTGCGILGIVIARRAKQVVAVDINPYAVGCSKENARRNRVGGKMMFVQGDLFAPLRVHEEFGLVLFNAPYLPVDLSNEGSWLESAWAGGVNGREVIDRFVSGVPRYLKKHGRVLLLQSTLSDVKKTLGVFENGGFEARVIAGRDLPFFETLVLVEAKRLD